MAIENFHDKKPEKRADIEAVLAAVKDRIRSKLRASGDLNNAARQAIGEVVEEISRDDFMSEILDHPKQYGGFPLEQQLCTYISVRILNDVPLRIEHTCVDEPFLQFAKQVAFLFGRNGQGSSFQQG